MYREYEIKIGQNTFKLGLSNKRLFLTQNGTFDYAAGHEIFECREDGITLTEIRGDSDLMNNCRNGIEPMIQGIFHLDHLWYKCPCCKYNIIVEFWGNEIYNCQGDMINCNSFRICRSCYETIIKASDMENFDQFYYSHNEHICNNYAKLIKIHPIFQEESLDVSPS